MNSIEEDQVVIKASSTKRPSPGYVQSERSMYHSSPCACLRLLCPAITECWTLGNLHTKDVCFLTAQESGTFKIKMLHSAKAFLLGPVTGKGWDTGEGRWELSPF